MKKWYDVSLWEQPLLDLWVIPHTLFGVLVAAICAFAGFNMFAGLCATVVAAILWEVGEASIGTSEFFSNRIGDVIVATVGYLALWLIINKSNLDHSSVKNLLFICFTLVIITNVIGWTAYFNYSK